MTQLPARRFEADTLKTGNALLELDFHHENYPEGVRDKRYRLEVLVRGTTYVLARSVEHRPSACC